MSDLRSVRIAALVVSLGGLALTASPALAQAGARMLAAAYDDAGSGTGRVVALRAAAPWDELHPALVVGSGAQLRSAYGRLYAVSRGDATVTVIDVATWTIERVIPTGPGSDPIDIAVIDPTTAYVSRRGDSRLLRVDVETGATQDATDLAPLADADGNPEAGFMIAHGGHLIVAIERFSDGVPFGFQPPTTLAVVDLATGQLVDVDPIAPGMQGIELSGTAAKHDMQILPGDDTLYVSASGDFFDAGGIEAVDLTTLATEGLLIPESGGEIGADLGAFVFVDATGGYLVFSTDLIESTHLVEFTTAGFVGPELISIVAYRAPVLIHDPLTGLLYLPQAQNRADGVHVFQASDGTRLTPNPVPLGGPPTDLVISCAGAASCGDPACATSPVCVEVPVLGAAGCLVLAGAMVGVGVPRSRRRWPARVAEGRPSICVRRPLCPTPPVPTRSRPACST